MKKLSFSSISVALAVAFLVGGTVWAFTGPTGAPPTNNVDMPIHVGADDQIKTGGIAVGSLSIDGGVAVNIAGGGGKPACDSSLRGTLWFTHGAAGVQDTLEVCAKDALDAYDWRLLY